MHFNRASIARRPALREADFLYAFAAEEIAERMAFTTRTFETAVYSGPALASVVTALSAAGPDWTVASPTPWNGAHLVADTAMPFRRAFPLAVSLNDLHVTPDPVAALGEMRGALKPDGLFLGAVPCTGTLHELIDALVHAESDISGGAGMRVAPFADVRRWGDALARAGYALPVADEMRITVRYGQLRSLFNDLAAMGMRRVLARRNPAPRRLFDVAERYYQDNHADGDGRLRATFVFAFLSGWAPDASQQKPARRGSANMSLEDALKRFS